MNVKIDTKEKFTTIKPEESIISANMTDELQNLFISFKNKEVPHIVFNVADVLTIEKQAVEMIADMQQLFYDESHSFIVCEMQPTVEAIFEQEGLLEQMNVTPTESEAWDILQMEEIEREILGD